MTTPDQVDRQVQNDREGQEEQLELRSPDLACPPGYSWPTKYKQVNGYYQPIPWTGAFAPNITILKDIYRQFASSWNKEEKGLFVLASHYAGKKLTRSSEEHVSHHPLILKTRQGIKLSQGWVFAYTLLLLYQHITGHFKSSGFYRELHRNLSWVPDLDSPGPTAEAKAKYLKMQESAGGNEKRGLDSTFVDDELNIGHQPSAKRPRLSTQTLSAENADMSMDKPPMQLLQNLDNLPNPKHRPESSTMIVSTPRTTASINPRLNTETMQHTSALDGSISLPISLPSWYPWEGGSISQGGSPLMAPKVATPTSQATSTRWYNAFGTPTPTGQALPSHQYSSTTTGFTPSNTGRSFAFSADSIITPARLIGTRSKQDSEPDTSLYLQNNKGGYTQFSESITDLGQSAPADTDEFMEKMSQMGFEPAAVVAQGGMLGQFKRRLVDPLQEQLDTLETDLRNGLEQLSATVKNNRDDMDEEAQFFGYKRMEEAREPIIKDVAARMEDIEGRLTAMEVQHKQDMDAMEYRLKEELEKRSAAEKRADEAWQLAQDFSVFINKYRDAIVSKQPVDGSAQAGQDQGCHKMD